MKYQLTYAKFIGEALNNERINQLKARIANLNQKHSIEADPDRKKHIEKQIKVNQLRLMIAQIG